MLITVLIAVFFLLVVGYSLQGIFAKRDKTRYTQPLAQDGQSAGDNTTAFFDQSAPSIDTSFDAGCSDSGAADGGSCDGGGGE